MLGFLASRLTGIWSLPACCFLGSASCLFFCFFVSLLLGLLSCLSGSSGFWPLSSGPPVGILCLKEGEGSWNGVVRHTSLQHFRGKSSSDPPHPSIAEDSDFRVLSAHCSPPQSEMQSDANGNGDGSSRKRLYTLGGVQTVPGRAYRHIDSYNSTQLASSALCCVVKGTVLTSRVPRASGKFSTL